MRKRTFVLGIAVSFILISAGLIFSQEPAPEEKTAPESQSEPEILWLWGEAVSADAANKTIAVKYLDYETDEEKELTINADDKTTYENINSIGEIKPSDTVSIDYIVNPDGKNIAKNISVEKPEAALAPQQGAAETTPEDLNPVAPAQE